MTESKSLLSVLVEQSPDATIFADPTGIIRVWNEASTRIFGYTEKGAVGQSLDIIIPERFRKSHWDGYKRALSDGYTKYAGQALTTKASRSDRSTIYVDMSFSIILGADHKAIGVLSQVRDITERYEKERGQRKRIKELELALDGEQDSD